MRSPLRQRFLDLAPGWAVGLPALMGSEFCSVTGDLGKNVVEAIVSRNFVAGFASI
jgi:hypothetical protein